MIKKMLLFICFYTIGLHASASDKSEIALLSAAEKQDLLLSYMFNKGFVAEMVPYIQPYNVVRRIESLQELCRLYQPGQQPYALAKAVCRDIYSTIQEPSLEDRESIIRLFTRYNVEPIIQCKLDAIQQFFEASGLPQRHITREFRYGITAFLNAVYLQQSLEIPCIKDQEFDTLYYKKITETFEHLRNAVILQTSFDVEEPQIIKDLLSHHDLDSTEIDGLVAVAFDEVKEILNTHVKQNEALRQSDPQCGF